MEDEVTSPEDFSVQSAFAGVAHSQRAFSAQRIDLAEKRIDDINAQIKALEKWQTVSSLGQVKANRADWTQVYKHYDNYDDLEELSTRRTEELAQKDLLVQNASNLLGHYHDHSQERAIFEMPEPEKKKFCERYRLLGNYLFEEGIYAKAAENYRIGLSYYEYCFPDDDEEQRQLDELRRICHCNISLCYYRLGEYRDAINAAALAIKDSRGQFWKAYCRRGLAYQALDEYQFALDDFQAAFALQPADSCVTQAITKLKMQMKGALELQSHMAKQMFSASTSSIASIPPAEMTSTSAPSCKDIYFDLAFPLEPGFG